ncbi:hypothetical protein SCYAM73S_06572 [Streptomyces cyaneofuscatus]
MRRTVHLYGRRTARVGGPGTTPCCGSACSASTAASSPGSTSTNWRRRGGRCWPTASPAPWPSSPTRSPTAGRSRGRGRSARCSSPVSWRWCSCRRAGSGGRRRGCATRWCRPGWGARSTRCPRTTARTRWGRSWYAATSPRTGPPPPPTYAPGPVSPGCRARSPPCAGSWSPSATSAAGSCWTCPTHRARDPGARTVPAGLRQRDPRYDDRTRIIDDADRGLSVAGARGRPGRRPGLRDLGRGRWTRVPSWSRRCGRSPGPSGRSR